MKRNIYYHFYKINFFLKFYIIGLSSFVFIFIILWALHDITERKQAEKALIENQRLSTIEEMASFIAHDFNNSLQSIFGNLELALLNPNIPDISGYEGEFRSVMYSIVKNPVDYILEKLVKMEQLIGEVMLQKKNK